MFSLFVTGSHRYDSVRPLSYADADLIMICFSVAEPDSMDHAISRVSDAINDVIFTFNEIKKKKPYTEFYVCVKFFSFNFRKKPNEFWICVWNNFGFFFFFSGQVKSENIAQNNLSYWSAAKRTCGQTLRR